MCENSGQFSHPPVRYQPAPPPYATKYKSPVGGWSFFLAAAILLPLLVDNFRFRRVNAAKEKAKRETSSTQLNWTELSWTELNWTD